MKKKLIGIAVLLSVLLLSGCGNLTMPETISIRSKAKYNFTIANKSFDLKEYFSLSALLKGTGINEQVSNNNRYNIYEYNPNGISHIQQFIMQMDVQDIPLDFGKFLSQADLSASIHGMSIDKEFEVPEIDLSEVKEIDLEVNEKINGFVTFAGVTNSETALEFEFTNEENYFETIEYKSGYMAITTIANIKDIDFSNLEHLNLDLLIPEKLNGSVKILKNSQVISQAEFKDGIAFLPLDNVYLENNGMSFSFDTKPDVLFYGKIVSESVIKRITGLCVKDSIDDVPLETTIKVGNQSDFESCEIDSGSIEVVFNKPESWSGINLNYVINTTGALEATISDSNPQYDLSGKTIRNGDIDVKTVMSVGFKNATISFIDSEGKKQNPSVSINTKIEKIKSAVVNLGTDYNARIQQTETLSDEVLNIVRDIVWNRSGIEIDYTNTLPEGNEMVINMTSDFLGFNNDKRVIVHTEENETEKIEYLCEDGRKTKFGKEPGEFSAIDVLAEFSFPNYDPIEKTIKVQNVEPGKKYKLAFEIKPVFDWESISIDSSVSNQSGVINAGLNLSSIFNGVDEALGINLAESVEIKALPLYLFCDIPAVEGAFEDPQYRGTIKAFVGDENNNPVLDDNGESVEIYLLGGDSKTNILPSLSAPELKPNENNEITMDLAVELNKLNGYEGIDLSKLITTSSTDGLLCIDYDVTFVTGNDDAITLTADTIKKLIEGPTSIKLSAFVVLSLDFNVTSPVELDLIKFTGKDTSEENYDLLGRQEPTSFEDLQKFIDMIESVAITYAPSEIPFHFYPFDNANDFMKLVIDLDGDGTDFEERELSLKGDVFTENPSSILGIYPLQPKLNLVIPVGNLSIPREMKFSTRIDLGISTNGQIKIWDKYAEKSEGGN